MSRAGEPVIGKTEPSFPTRGVYKAEELYAAALELAREQTDLGIEKTK